MRPLGQRESQSQYSWQRQLWEQHLMLVFQSLVPTGHWGPDGTFTDKSCTQERSPELTLAVPLWTSSSLRDDDSKLNYTGILKLAGT